MCAFVYDRLSERAVGSWQWVYTSSQYLAAFSFPLPYVSIGDIAIRSFAQEEPGSISLNFQI
jgi:hypothetical protein